MPLGVTVEPSRMPLPTILEIFHLVGCIMVPSLLPFNGVYPGHEAVRFGKLLRLLEAEQPLLVVGVMPDNASKLVVLWRPSQHLNLPYDCMPLMDGM
jgi:hypothetical protein